MTTELRCVFSPLAGDAAVGEVFNTKDATIMQHMAATLVIFWMDFQPSQTRSILDNRGYVS